MRFPSSLVRGASARPFIASAAIAALSASAGASDAYADPYADPYAADPYAADPYADFVIDFVSGVGAEPGYDDPVTAVGAPERFTGEDGYPGVVSVFYPPFGVDEIVSLGCGGVLEVAFDEPVTDDPANPHGVDLLVFGNTGFIDADWPNGRVGGLFGADGGTLEVSTDGSTWVEVPLVAADGPLPTNGYLDVGPYDFEPGTVESVFTRPVDPTVTVADLLGLSYAEILAVYDGSGGGVGIDLATTGLAEIFFVRVTNACPGESVNVEIDAFCDVAPRLAGDANRDGVVDFADVLALLAAWGDCPAPPFPCPLDIDGDGGVGFGDVLTVLANWTA